jgi:predicted alpha/beta superfamily hydrolase
MTMTSNRRGALAALMAGLGIVPARALAAAAPAPDAGYAIPFTTVIPLKSRMNGIDYRLYVRVPAEYDRTATAYPTVWLLDADYSFAIACSHVEHLADRAHIPNQIVVAIAYAGVYPDMERYRRERSRDYTPIFAADGGYGPEFQRASGGGPKFLEMIATEAMPLIERHFRTDPAHRTLTGHSYGGLFASWVLQERPDLFDRYLIVSPSLWYADEWILKREAAGTVRPLTRPTRVWAGVGSWEEHAGDYPMVSQLERFAAQLAARKNGDLFVRHKVVDDETHASIFPAAFSTGMRYLFPNDALRNATPAQLDQCVAAGKP